MVELIIFDNDGVLVDSEPHSNRVFTDYLNSHDIPITLEECMGRFVGLSMATSKKMIEDDGYTLPDSFVDDIRSGNLAAFSKGIDATPGTTEALKEISLPKCVASSGMMTKIRYTLTLTNLIDHLDPHLFSAQHVENGKPAPDLFLYADKQMGVAPENAVVVEDSKAGVQAAVAANIPVIGFIGGGHILPGHDKFLMDLGAIAIIDDMRDLMPTISRLL